MMCSLYTVKSVIFNLDHEIDSFHFISNEEDPNPQTTTSNLQCCDNEKIYANDIKYKI